MWLLFKVSALILETNTGIFSATLSKRFLNSLTTCCVLFFSAYEKSERSVVQFILHLRVTSCLAGSSAVVWYDVSLIPDIFTVVQ